MGSSWLQNTSNLVIFLSKDKKELTADNSYLPSSPPISSCLFYCISPLLTDQEVTDLQVQILTYT